MAKASKRFFIFVLSAFLFLPEVKSQILFYNDSLTPEKEGEVQVLYRNEWSLGGLIHSHGFGANFRRGKHLTGYKKLMYELEFINIRHPKEHKSFNRNLESSKGFIFGKMNNFYCFRPGIGFQQVIVSKLGEGKVEIRGIILGGLSLGILKPVYLIVLNSNSTKYSTERYDPKKHSIDKISGKGPFTKGFDELTLVPGGYIKAGLSFEYSDDQEGIKAIETGVAIDFFNKRIPIMAKIDGIGGYDPNNPVFINLYLSLLFGEKWF